MIINSRDVTDRKQAEEALQESEARYRSLVESTHDLVYSIGADGHFLFVNSAWLKTLGYAAEEVPVLTLFDIIHPDFHPHCRALFPKVIAGQEIPSVRLDFVAKDGRVIPVEGSVSGRLLDNGQLAAHGFFRNITERVRLEEEKQQLHLQMAHMEKLQAVGVLAGGVAHDFNNLLTPILGFSEMLRKSLPVGTVARNNLEKVLQAGRRAKGLVQQLLTFSRPSPQARQPVNLTREVEESVRLLKTAASDTISIQTTTDTPHSMVLAEPVQIHRVIMNLGMNALHALEDQGGNLALSVQRVALDKEFSRQHPPLTPGAYYKLRVQDTGCGMTTEVRTRIFDPFFTTKPIGQGTGLGLSVVHGVINSYGGVITVESELGKGTTFDVYLPCAPEPTAKEEALVDSAQQGGGCVLCIDNEETITLAMRHMLEELGYEVSTATSVAEAIAIFHEAPERFALVVADPTIPGLTEEQLLRELRTVRPHLPVILCSSARPTAMEEPVQTVEAISYLQKPFSQEELSSALQRAFRAEEETKLL